VEHLAGHDRNIHRHDVRAEILERLRNGAHLVQPDPHVDGAWPSWPLANNPRHKHREDAVRTKKRDTGEPQQGQRQRRRGERFLLGKVMLVGVAE